MPEKVGAHDSVTLIRQVTVKVIIFVADCPEVCSEELERNTPS